jgi:hypothetical protein
MAVKLTLDSAVDGIDLNGFTLDALPVEVDRLPPIDTYTLACTKAMHLGVHLRPSMVPSS